MELRVRLKPIDHVGEIACHIDHPGRCDRQAADPSPGDHSFWIVGAETQPQGKGAECASGQVDRHEAPCSSFSHQQVAILRESQTFGAWMSSKKDHLVNIGGWLAMNHDDLFEAASNLVVVYEGLHTYGGMAGRDMEALAIGIEEALQDDHMNSRIGQVLYLGELLTDWGIPIVHPVGGHAIFLDARVIYAHVPQDRFPAQTLAAQLYLDSGIRAMERGVVSAGRDPATGDHRYPKLELVRLTIPRRVYTQAHMDVVAEAVKAVYDERAKVQGLQMVYEPQYLRFFQARFAPV